MYDVETDCVGQKDRRRPAHSQRGHLPSLTLWDALAGTPLIACFWDEHMTQAGQSDFLILQDGHVIQTGQSEYLFLITDWFVVI